MAISRRLLLVLSLLCSPALSEAAELITVPIESARFSFTTDTPSCPPEPARITLAADSPSFPIDPSCGGGSIALVDGKLVAQGSTARMLYVQFSQADQGISVTTPVSGTGLVPLVLSAPQPNEFRPLIRTTAGGVKHCWDADGGGAYPPITCSTLSGELATIQSDSAGLYAAPTGPEPFVFFEVLTSSEVGTVASAADLDAISVGIGALNARVALLEASQSEQDSGLAALAASDTSHATSIDTLTSQVSTLEARVRKLEKKAKPSRGDGAELAFIVPGIALGLRRHRC